MKAIKSKEYYANLEFLFNSITWHEVPKEYVLFIGEVGELLSSKLKLSQYGNGLKQIFFVPIIKKPSNTIHETKYRFFPRKKEIDAEVRMDYKAVMQASSKEFKVMLAHLFLVTLTQFKQENIQDFDIDALKTDVEDIFEAQGWMVPA